MIIGNGVFGMNSGAAIGYQMNFIVQGEGDLPPNDVPEPESLFLLCLGIAALGFSRRISRSALSM
jgi:hypothetical protein